MIVDRTAEVVETISSRPHPPGTISVVVPSYNHGPFVQKCLLSVIRQTLSPLELIVIDDGSVDESPKVIEQTLSGCPFSCELIVRSNKGLCATLNEGLRRTRGHYFAYLGSDDAWLPEFLRARVELLESRSNAVLAYGHAYIIDAHDHIVECTREWARYVDGNVQQMLLRNPAPLSPTVLHKRDVLEQYGWNEAAGLEDYELYLRLSARGDFAFDARVLSAWRQHGYNTSRNLGLMIEECLEAQRRVGPVLGLSACELEETQAAIRWRYAEDFIRSGRKSEAFGLACRNIKGAPSLASLALMPFRLLEPRRLMQWRRRYSRLKAIEHYGTLEI